MRKLFIFFACMALSWASMAQTNAVEIRNHLAGQKVIDLLNRQEVDSIYWLFDENMRKAMTEGAWMKAAESQLLPLVPIAKTQFLSLGGHASFYRLETASIPWTMQVAANEKNEISLLYFSPMKSQIIKGGQPMTSLDSKTDSQAQLLKEYYNRKETDSLYALTGKSFQQQVKKEDLRKSLEAQLFPLGPIAQFSFEGSQNNISKYRAELGGTVLQMLVGLDGDGKVGTFALQPYQETQPTRQEEIWHDNALATPADSQVHAIAMRHMQGTRTNAMSIGILKGTKGYYYNYGETKRGQDVHPMRTTLYEIGSITKTFTAWLLADAVAAGKLSLTDPITKYLPDQVAANRDLGQINLEQLANHTSGLPRLPTNITSGMQNASDPYAGYDTTQLFDFLTSYRAQNKPGEKYEYSNLGFGLLGTILERVYGQPLSQLYQQNIFKPFKMSASLASNITDSSLVAEGYNQKGERTPYWNFRSMAGAGAIKSNTEDLLKYALQFTLRPKTKGQPNPNLALLERVTYAKAPQFVSLAWHFDQAGEEGRTMRHSGGTQGFRSHLSIYPSQQLAVVVLCNSGSEPGASGVAETIQEKWQE